MYNYMADVIAMNSTQNDYAPLRLGQGSDPSPTKSTIRSPERCSI